MSFKDVYITKTGKFLPNGPVSNDEMEQYLGLINSKPSVSRRIVLRNNGIKNRFYAISKEGKPTHTNAEMTALAIRELFYENSLPLNAVQLISCGTSSPDQLIPSHGVMVHGFLPEMNNTEVVSLSGVCCSGMQALKFAYMAVKLGEVQNAISTGSERSSIALRSSSYSEEVQKLKELEQDPYISFEKDFLRWMLSDGAGAFLLTSTKNEKALNLKIDWLEGVSYANELEVCMYAGGEKTENGKLRGYLDYSPKEIANNSILCLKQDTKLLSQHVVNLGLNKLKNVLEKKGININDIDYFLPHMSSEFFRNKISEKLNELNIPISQDKWFTNLTTVGNVGAGSIYLIIDELFKSGKLIKGQKILLIVPESSRFSYVFGHLTVC